MKIVEILFPILMLGIYFLLSHKKKKNDTTSPPEVFDREVDQYEEEPEVYSEKIPETFMEIIKDNSSKNKYFSLTDAQNIKEKTFAARKEQSETGFVQTADNEKEIEGRILLDLDELKKAVIYSEILKRPYS